MFKMKKLIPDDTFDEKILSSVLDKLRAEKEREEKMKKSSHEDND